MPKLVQHMLKKSPLKYSVTRSASEISPNIVVNKSKRDLSEAKMVKLLLKFFNQERITVKKKEMMLRSNI